MTNKQASDLNDFLEQVKEKTLDSLDFAQMTFILEEVVGDDEGYSHPLLGELCGYLRVNYPDQYREFMNDLDEPAKQAVLRSLYNKMKEEFCHE